MPGFDNSTVASNPGGVRLQWKVYSHCNPAPLVALILFPICGAIIDVMLFWNEVVTSVFFTLTGAAMGAVKYYNAYSGLKIWMQQGDTNPAVVLDPEKGLLAMWADMTADRQRLVPAIKVFKAPIGRAPTGPFKKGERLTVVCIYSGTGWGGKWSDVHPVPVVCATGDPEVIRNSLESIPPEQWDYLSEGLAKLGERPRTKVHFL